MIGCLDITEDMRELTFPLLYIIPRLRLLVRARNPGYLEHLHRAVQHTMNDLEPSRPVAPDRGSMAHVSRLTFTSCVLEHDIGRFENLDRERVRAVLADGFEETWEQGGSDDLIFGRLGIGEPDGGLPVVFAVQPCEVFVMRALQEREESYGCVVDDAGTQI